MTFDLVQVQDFVAGLDARMGDGASRADPEQAAAHLALRDHAGLCHEFTEKVREWGRAVFGGWIEFDPEVELVSRSEGSKLAARAADLQHLGADTVAAGPGFATQDDFQAAVARMSKLLDHWVRPQLSVGPAARHRRNLSPEVMEEARRRLAALPPLPADFPFTEEQRRALGLS